MEAPFLQNTRDFHKSSVKKKHYHYLQAIKVENSYQESTSSWNIDIFSVNTFIQETLVDIWLTFDIPWRFTSTLFHVVCGWVGGFPRIGTLHSYITYCHNLRAESLLDMNSLKVS